MNSSILSCLFNKSVQSIKITNELNNLLEICNRKFSGLCICMIQSNYYIVFLAFAWLTSIIFLLSQFCFELIDMDTAFPLSFLTSFNTFLCANVHCKIYIKYLSIRLT